MVEGGERVESRQPEDRVTEPSMDRGDLRAEIVRKPDEGQDFHAPEERKRVALEPRASNRGSRECKEQQVERRLHGLRRDAHPAWDPGRVRLRVDHPPKHAHHDEREHAHP